jgi:soluble lytic murein transglycosylase-like protein
MKALFAAPVCALVVASVPSARADEVSLQPLIALHSAQNGVPEALVHRLVRRESNYNPAAVGGGGALGLMQIKYATARAMGYSGAPAGLLDANTNLTYAVRYLAGAYRVADGNLDRAVSYYARGYYYAAKRRGMTGVATARALAAPPTVPDVKATASIQSASAGMAATTPSAMPAAAQLSWADLR